MKMLILLPTLLILALVLFIAWAGYPWSLTEKKVVGEVVHIEPEIMDESEERPAVIKILSWNLGFLFGEGSEGPGYIYQDKSFYQEKLDKLAQEIKDWGPDIIFLQEIDIESARSQDMNQAQFLARKAGYPYVAEAISWEANYIPFPYWPVKNHFGRVKSGGAILSKYPILDHQILLLDKPKSQPWWYNIFYLHRYFQRVTIEIGERNFVLINLHLEAFDKVDRQEQITKLSQLVESENIDLVAGDFNMLPASASKRRRFGNSKDDYEDDVSYQLMMKSGLQEVIPDEIYAKDESLYFTFPASRPDRRLDYIFYRPDLKLMKAEVLSSTLSDHLPIRASFQINSPRVNPYSL